MWSCYIENCIKACYENPLFDDDGTLGAETHTTIHKHPDGFTGKPYDLNNGGAQTSVHYRQSQPRRKLLYCAGFIIAFLAIVAIIVAIVISQRNSDNGSDSNKVSTGASTDNAI
ncbi:hypothetical protein DPMN_041193 [Dreissena polymorpha]|uniref:Uncharacterized protein n=1 Tax=Dreissena polymorpha TaxID=45954 RepID=A0A9D4CWR8_DREPO|nr:hypothetical protein DPMN_041193 [Dreissena polymorpha]